MGNWGLEGELGVKRGSVDSHELDIISLAAYKIPLVCYQKQIGKHLCS